MCEAGTKEEKTEVKEEEGDSSMCADEGDDADDWCFAWDANLQLAWRSKSGPESAEYSEPLDGSIPRVAKWSDGVTWLVPGDFPDRRRARGGGDPLALLWSGTHKVTTNELKCEQKTDRGLILILLVQGKQKGQIKVEYFGKLEDPMKMLHPQHDVMARALEFFHPVVREVCWR